MTSPVNSTPAWPLIDPGLLGAWIAQKPYMWQMKLLDASDLARLTGAHGFKLGFGRADIEQLWQIGLLKADIVKSVRKPQRQGFVDRGVYGFGLRYFSDERMLRPRKWGMLGLASRLGDLDDDVKPLFHPYRYFVLVHLDRMLQLGFSPLQLLQTKKSIRWSVRWLLDQFQRGSSGASVVQAIERWNNVTALAVALEPCFYQRLSGGSVTIPPELIEFAGQERDIEKLTDAAYARLLDQLDQHWLNVAPILRTIGPAGLEEVRQELCIECERVDPNKDLHVLLRLERGDERFKLKGHIGGAVYLNTMAEMLRRAAERAFDEQLPEEDERGFGMIFEQTKIQLYGSARVADRHPDVAAAFIRHFGLDYRPSLRWYLEGPTEYHAVNEIITAFGTTSSIGLVDLSGNFLERRDLLFRRNLEADKEQHVFSYVSLDGGTHKNEKDNVRLVKKAAKDGAMLGRFFISEPDFEFANFELDELEEVLWSLADQYRASSVIEATGSDVSNIGVVGLPADAPLEEQRQALHVAIKGAQNAETLIKAAKGSLVVLNHLSKGKDWGQALMRYAWAHRMWRGGQTRLVVLAVESAMRMRTSNYNFVRDRYLVDPETGTLAAKPATPAA